MDLIQMDDYPAESCAISHSAFLFNILPKLRIFHAGHSAFPGSLKDNEPEM